MSENKTKNPPMDRKVKALDYFKDWSNYLLVTTVAALGWVSKEVGIFHMPWLRYICIASFALSIIFAILTLALIPHVSEQITDNVTSIYDVEVEHYFIRKKKKYHHHLRDACFPQHVLFLIGILAFAIGTA